MNFRDMNNIDWDDWQNCVLTTEALWLNDPSEAHYIDNPLWFPPNDPDFHGLFIPYIPYQMLLRFTVEGEMVWDCFAGTGTTWRVAQAMNRECICNDITSRKPYIIEADSRTFDPGQMVQLIIMHPPYWGIVKYDGDDALSGAVTLKDFLISFEEVVANVVRFLDDDRILVLVCGNIYAAGEEITLGVLCKDIIRDYGFRLRSHIVKTYGETKGGAKHMAKVHRYRMLRGGYNRFYGDNIFILQKRTSNNRYMEVAALRSGWELF